MVEALLQAGVDAEARDTEGKTALDHVQRALARDADTKPSRLRRNRSTWIAPRPSRC